MSQFSVEVVRIAKIEKNPNADSLSITEALGNPVQFRTPDYGVGSKAVYVPIDSMVPVNRPEFAFLANKDKPKEYERIKAKKLRGVFSCGLLLPVPARPEWQQKISRLTLGFLYAPYDVGDDLAEVLGVKKFEEEEDDEPDTSTSLSRLYRKWKWKLFGKKSSGPKEPRGRVSDKGPFPHYEIENVRRYKEALIEGEQVVIFEKLHGCQFRAGWVDGEWKIASHRRYRNPDDTNPTNHWGSVARSLKLKERLDAFKDHVVYGEVFGVSETGKPIQDLTYGATEPTLKIFDVYFIPSRRWFNADEIIEFANSIGIGTPPVLYRGDWKGVDYHAPTLETKSKLCPANIMEGGVIRPVLERSELKLGRVVLKLVTQNYLLRKGGSEKH